MTARFEIRVVSGDRALAAVSLALILEGGTDELHAITDSRGIASFELEESAEPEALIAAPYAGHWEMLLHRPQSGQRVDCPPLPMSDELGWWHEVLGTDPESEGAGVGIRVGVVDSGCGPHPFLRHVIDAGAFLHGKHRVERSSGSDGSNHGTHVCGILASRPPSGAGYRGVAPGIELVSARVFDDDNVACQDDIANAIEWLVQEHGVDLVSLSLGAHQLSRILREQLLQAQDEGVLCFCAAGNGAEAVLYPAALEEVVGVGALGRLGWGVPGSLAAARAPEEPQQHGVEGLYLARFSARGPGLDVVGPGVGVISPVPERFGLSAPVAVMDGTSMACPAVAGAAAVILAADEGFRSMARSPARTRAARAILRVHCRGIGLASNDQGWGLPTIRRRPASAG
jgi:subtilisin